MNTSKIIKGVVGGGRYTVTAPIIKEDYGLYLKIEGLELPETYQVDFSNSEHNGTSVTMIGNSDGVLIPSQFISSGKDVFAFLYHVGVDFGRTLYKFRIPNKLRPDRTDETPTPEEQSVIDQTIAALNDAVESAQDAQQAIEDMSVSAESLPEGSEATVTKSEQDGVVHLTFGIPTGATGATGAKGDKGDKGDTGAQGIKGDQGEQGIQGIQGIQGERGEKGDKGDTGAQGVAGQDGYSPSATVTKVGDTATITITDKNGTTTAQISDGSGGGSATSPTASVAKVGDTATITITDINGTTTASISDGKDGTNGTNGQDGYSPTASVSKSGGTATITITDKNGTTTATVSDGTNGQNGTNGTDGTDGTDGTTFTPSVSNAGVISWTNDGGKQNPSSVDLVAAIPTATTQADGKMSATDKGRLDTLYADYSSALTALGVI